MFGQSRLMISTVVFMLENWVQHRFQKPPFSSVHTKTKRFQKSPFLVEMTPPTHRLHVYGRLKRYAFPEKMHTCGRGLNDIGISFEDLITCE